MSIRWFEGFDQYGSSGGQPASLPGQGLWAGSGLVITTVTETYAEDVKARTGTFFAMTKAQADMRRSLGEDATTVGVGVGFYMGNLPITSSYEGAICQFRDVNNKCQIHVAVGTTGRIAVFRGGFDGRLSPSPGGNTGGAANALLGMSTLELAPGTWNHIETKVVFDTAAGSVEVIVNGKQTFLNLTGINTTSINADTVYCSQVMFGQTDSFIAFPYSFLAYDDIFVYDQNTGGVHDFLGEYGVYTLMPNANDGSYHVWQLSSGSSGFALIDEIPPDDDTTFVFSTAVNDRSDFGVQPLPANISLVAAVMPCGRLKKTDTGDADVELGVNSAGTVSYSSDTPITTSYTYFEPIVFEADPNGSGPWNPAAMPELTVKRTV